MNEEIVLKGIFCLDARTQMKVETTPVKLVVFLILQSFCTKSTFNINTLSHFKSVLLLSLILLTCVLFT